MQEKKSEGLQINAKTFISTIIILLVIMIAAGILTRVMPQGAFERTVSESGNVVVVPGTYEQIDGNPLPVWRWFTAPFEVLADEESITAIVIIVFILLVGGTFAVLEKCGVFRYVIAATIKRFGSKKYVLLAAISFLCMLLGSVIGLLEETVAFVPLLVSLALALGWDSLVGLGMSLLSVGFGFAAGTFNPFTVAVVQRLADVPLYSGLWLRAIFFVIVYAVLVLFLIRYAKRIEADPTRSIVYESDIERRKRYVYDENDPIIHNKGAKNAAAVFGCALGLIFAYVIVALIVPSLSDYTMPVMALLMAVGGLVAGAVSKYREKGMLGDFFRGILSIAPCVLIIVMALSVKFIIQKGGIMDTILYETSSLLSDVSPFVAILLVYLLVLIIEFFIGSASAKAFLIIPIIVPLADIIGLTRQSIVLAFCMSDGFTNVFFPTNPLILIVLGLVGIPYAKWFRFSWKPQLIMLFITSAVLLFAVSVGY